MMNIEELYETELWNKLNKNNAFYSKFNEVIKRCRYYVREEDVKLNIKDEKLVVSYKQPLRERENNCQCTSEVYFEFFLDDDNLIINKISGEMRSNLGYDFSNSSGGVLDTSYSCEVYDPDGIELAYQGYMDSINLESDTFNVFKEGFSGALNSAFNPNLDQFANVTGVYPKSTVLGTNPWFVREIRSKDNLGIVEFSKCQFDETGKVINQQEKYFINTFYAEQSAMHPETICYMRDYPLAIIDENHQLHFNEIYKNISVGEDEDHGLRLTSENYKEVVKYRFLKELQDEKERIGRHAPKDVIDKYDLMIERLEQSMKKEERTIK